MKASDVIVDEIRRVLDDPDETTLEHLTDLAKEFTQKCRRFEEIVALVCAALDVGGLCEAARVAQNEKILDEYQALNFDHLEDWRDACRALGLPVSQPLSSANAARIAEFLVDYGNFEKLFATHRRLAISGGDVYSRLEILYQLKEAFPSVSSWNPQISALEPLRDQELQRLYLSAPPCRETFDFWLERLSELENPRRVLRCSDSFLGQLRAVLLGFQREIALEQAEAIAREWQIAAVVPDEANLIRLNNAWNQAVSDCSTVGATLPPELLEAVRVPRATLENLTRHNAAVAEYERKLRRLNDLLENSESLEEISAALEAAEIAADAAGVAVPTDIVEECEARFTASELQKRRKVTLLTAFGLLLAISLSTAAFLVARDSQIKRQARAAAAELQAKLDRFEGTDVVPPVHAALEEAQTVLETYQKSPKIAASQEFKDQAERFATFRRQEDERLKNFNDDVAALKEAHERPVSRPHILQRLKENARTEAETNLYLDLKTRDAEIRRQEVNANDGEYLERLTALVDRKEALETNAPNDVESFLSEIASIREELRKLDADFTERVISQHVQDTRVAFVHGFNQLEQKAQNEADLQKIAVELQGVVGDATRFESALSRLSAKTSPENVAPASAALRLLPAFESWNQFVRQYGDAPDAWTESSASYRQVVSLLTPAFESLSEFSPEIVDVRARFENIDANALGRKELAQELKIAFEVFKPKLYLYAPPGGDYYYYLTTQPKDVPKKPPVEYCVNVVNGELETESFNLTIVKPKEYDKIKLAIQYVLYEKIQALPTVPTAEEWRACVEETLTTLLETDESSLDPAAKILMLKRLLQVICRDPDYQAFNEWNDVLANVNLATNHYKSSRTLRNFRDEAKRLTQRLETLADESARRGATSVASPYLDRARQSFEARRQTPDLAPYRWVGFVDVVDKVAQLAKPDGLTLEDGTLYLVKFNGSVPRAEACGQVQNGQATLNAGFVAQRWNLVFLRPRQGEAPSAD